MQGETGESPVRARRREVHSIQFSYLPRCHNPGKAIGET